MSDKETSLNVRISELAEAKDWDELLNLTNDLSLDQYPPTVCFFRGRALQMKERHLEAIDAIKCGLTKTPANAWGQTLLFESRIAVGEVETAFDQLRQFIETSDGNVENLKSTYVDRAVRSDRFDLAGVMNETRKVIFEDKDFPKYALALQCFNKSDTLEQVFSSLERCQNTRKFALVIIQDSALNSKKPEAYSPAADEVRQVIGKWLPKLMRLF